MCNLNSTLLICQFSWNQVLLQEIHFKTVTIKRFREINWKYLFFSTLEHENEGIHILKLPLVTTNRFVYVCRAVMYYTMHFGAWRNRGILIYNSINKHWIFRRSLYQSKNVIFPLIATYYNNTSKFVIFSDQCLFRNSQRMSTARLAGKTIDDVLYPKIEPYKTGMLKVRQ